MPSSTASDGASISCPAELVAPLESIVAALKGLQFGQLTVVVHDGAVVQIDRTERRRLAPKPRGAGS